MSQKYVQRHSSGTSSRDADRKDSEASSGPPVDHGQQMGASTQSLAALMSAGGNQGMAQLSRGDESDEPAPASVSEVESESELGVERVGGGGGDGAPEGDVSGTIEEVAGAGFARSQGDPQRKRGDGDGDDAGSDAGGAAGATPDAPEILKVASSISLTTEILNDKATTPFGAMSPDYRLTASYSTAGDTINLTVAFKAIAHWGVAGGSRTDITSGSAAAVTADKYQEIHDDLKPSASSPHKSRRRAYWSKALTARHEKYHATDDFKWINAEGLALAKAFMDSKTIDKSAIDAKLGRLIAQTKAKLDAGSVEYYYGGASDPGHSNRAGEILAYGDGKPEYESLVTAVKTHGEALAAQAAEEEEEETP